MVRTAVVAGLVGSTHGPNGSCWSGTQAQADACTATCKTSLAELKASHSDAGCT